MYKQVFGSLQNMAFWTNKRDGREARHVEAIRHTALMDFAKLEAEKTVLISSVAELLLEQVNLGAKDKQEDWGEVYKAIKDIYIKTLDSPGFTMAAYTDNTHNWMLFFDRDINSALRYRSGDPVTVLSEEWEFTGPEHRAEALDYLSGEERGRLAEYRDREDFSVNVHSREKTRDVFHEEDDYQEAPIGQEVYTSVKVEVFNLPKVEHSLTRDQAIRISTEVYDKFYSNCRAARAEAWGTDILAGVMEGMLTPEVAKSINEAFDRELETLKRGKDETKQ